MVEHALETLREMELASEREGSNIKPGVRCSDIHRPRLVTRRTSRSSPRSAHYRLPPFAFW